MIRIERFNMPLDRKEWFVVYGKTGSTGLVTALPFRSFLRNPIAAARTLLNNGTERLLGPPDFTWWEVWLFVFAVDLGAGLFLLFMRWALGPLL